MLEVNHIRTSDKREDVILFTYGNDVEYILSIEASIYIIRQTRRVTDIRDWEPRSR